MEGSKGDVLMAEAEASLKKWRLFGNKYEDAVDKFKDAGNAYKLAKCWQEAGMAFKRQAECYLQLGSKNEASSAFQAAAASFQKCSAKDAVECLTRTIELSVDDGRFQNAAKYEQQIAEILEENGDADAAMEHYQTAADYYDGENQTSAASKVKLKIAEHCGLSEKYDRAIEIFEQTGVAYLANNLLKYSAKDLFFKAGICHLCSDDLIAAKRAVQRYQDLDVTFVQQRECRLLLKLVECCEKFDADKFALALKEYHNITPLDNWKMTLLSRVKDSLLKHQGGAGAEDMT